MGHNLIDCKEHYNDALSGDVDDLNNKRRLSPILVDLSTSLDGTFLFSSVKANSMFSFVCPGSSSVDLKRSMSSITTTLLKDSIVACLYTFPWVVVCFLG
uniref:Uncharacterized protein n=1 Tax=Anguilla anguilla TaxID=7936 RepID=A0A0E9WLD8_ANGAN